MPCPALSSRPVAALMLAGALSLGAAAPALAQTTTLPAEFPTLSKDPALAQRQAMGCTVVGLGLTGLAFATGVVSTGGGAAAAGPVVGELLAYFGAGCTMGAFIATALPLGNAPADATTPATEPDADPLAAKRRLRIQAAELVP